MSKLNSIEGYEKIININRKKKNLIESKKMIDIFLFTFI